MIVERCFPSLLSMIEHPCMTSFWFWDWVSGSIQQRTDGTAFLRLFIGVEACETPCPAVDWRQDLLCKSKETSVLSTLPAKNSRKKRLSLGRWGKRSLGPFRLASSTRQVSSLGLPSKSSRELQLWGPEGMEKWQVGFFLHPTQFTCQNSSKKNNQKAKMS